MFNRPDSPNTDGVVNDEGYACIVCNLCNCGKVGNVEFLISDGLEVDGTCLFRDDALEFCRIS